MTSATSTGQRVSPWATGLIVFAGAIMVVAGIWQVFSGTAALTHAAIYDGAPRYVYALDLTTWGWIQLLTGVTSIAVGYALLRGRTWARVVGIGLSALGMVTQFMFVPYFPIWSSLVIALDGMIIWGLASYRRETV